MEFHNYKLIRSDAHQIFYDNPYQQIEAIGRTCYKSENNIKEGSCYKFVKNMIDHQHFAMLEHGTLTFKMNGTWMMNQLAVIPYVVTSMDYPDNTWVTLSMSHLYNPRWRDYSGYSVLKAIRKAVETMVDREFDWSENAICKCICVDGHELQIEYIAKSKIADSDIPDKERHMFRSMKFTCDRGVSHELVRHRCAVAQESTRYCNYTKDKFGGVVTYVEPCNYAEWDDDDRFWFDQILTNSSYVYERMVENGATPQQARAVLPNALKTDCILTMSEEQWHHFFNLRMRGTTGAPHPDMRYIANIAHEVFYTEGFTG